VKGGRRRRDCHVVRHSDHGRARDSCGHRE